MKRSNKSSIAFLCVSFLLLILTLSACSSGNKDQPNTLDTMVTATATEAASDMVETEATATPTITSTPTATSTTIVTATPTIQFANAAPTEDVEPNEGIDLSWRLAQ